MRGVGGAATVAAREQFVAGSQTTQHHLRRAVQRLFERGQAPQGRRGFFNGALQLCHARKAKRWLQKEKTKPVRVALENS